MSAADAPTVRPGVAPLHRAPRGISTRLFRSELALIGGRRRNQMGLLVLAAIPIIMAIATKMTATDRRRGGDLLSSMTSNGLFVPLAALLVEMTMFLPLAIAMLSGDAIAGEANIGTLRYLLTVPVSRTRLLLVKYASLCFGALWGVLTVAVPGAIIGIALFGFGDMPTLSGTTLSGGAAIGRFALVIVYLTTCLAALAAVGLFISTLTEQPIAAAVAVMIFVIVSWILDGVPQLDWLHDWLLVDRWLAFQDFLRDPIAWHDISQGLFVNGLYAVVFWLLAWARFAGKDVTS
ncbi:MAG: ABC transporter permease [Dermatophilaceae bacterium]|nr:ABC transporter permease [Actinomycetales bacterium]MBP8880940.1 ABC transporter permease [Dermatophilaceae bacterium]MBP9919116.1 ABC transporter permease [Dermatophilaceae bacterium]